MKNLKRKKEKEEIIKILFILNKNNDILFDFFETVSFHQIKMNFLIKLLVFLIGIYISYYYYNYEKYKIYKQYLEKGNEYYFERKYKVKILIRLIESRKRIFKIN
jgi:hypothetical protein